jgi:hypothetical protein
MRFLLILVFFTLTLSLTAGESLEEKLKEIHSISFEKTPTIGSFNACYKILIQQPIDHSDSSKGFFDQKIYLSHKDFNKQVLFFINGYLSPKNKINDWSKLLDANQIYVEHRYYGESKPTDVKWETLNLKNASADLHNIKLVLSKIYKNNWISTGTSKGGLTSLAYKYYYPDDVEVTIAHSAPVGMSLRDTTVFTFIDSLSKSRGCLEKMKSFQRQLLLKKDEIIPLLKIHLDKRHQRYNNLGLHRIYEVAVLEIPFSIWQNNKGCNAITINDTTSSGLFKSLRTAIYDWFLSDNVFNEIGAYHYQALTELGYYDYPTSEFKTLLNSDKNSPPSRILIPKRVKINYSKDLMSEIKKWLTDSGNNIIYMNGANDPYSFYRISPSNKTNAVSLIIKNGNHNQAKYRNLDAKQKIETMSYLNKWLK